MLECCADGSPQSVQINSGVVTVLGGRYGDGNSPIIGIAGGESATIVGASIAGSPNSGTGIGITVGGNIRISDCIFGLFGDALGYAVTVSSAYTGGYSGSAGSTTGNIVISNCSMGQMKVMIMREGAIEFFMFQESRFVFVANVLCLDFVNTEKAVNGHLTDLITDLRSFLNWLVAAGVLDNKEALISAQSLHGKPLGDEVLEKAHQLRKAIRMVADEITSENQIKRGDKSAPEGNLPIIATSPIDEINAILRLCLGYEHIDISNGNFVRSFICDLKNPLSLLYPIAHSASELLCEKNQSFVRRCENPNCVLYFYDTSKNHSRRWCSMSTCGNRIKVAAHYKRRRKFNPS